MGASAMIDRVATALKRSGDQDMEYLRDLARAAIEAMREPTDDQRNKYYELRFKLHTFDDATWEASIDAALEG